MKRSITGNSLKEGYYIAQSIPRASTTYTVSLTNYVTHTSMNWGGDNILVGSGSATCIIYDDKGKEIFRISAGGAGNGNTFSNSSKFTN